MAMDTERLNHLARSASQRLRAGISAGATAALQVLAPAQCAACDTPVPSHATFCSGCGDPEPAEPALLHGTWAAASYSPPLSVAIARMKFGPRPDVAQRLLEWFQPPLARCEAGAPQVVPVPLHPWRLAERGFNPAALLARGVAGRFGLRFAPALLQRTTCTARQSDLSRAERRHNVRGAFQVARSRVPARVVLVDDVVTTGATLDACRKALQAAGVAEVGAVALARAPALNPSRRAQPRRPQPSQT